MKEDRVAGKTYYSKYWKMSYTVMQVQVDKFGYLTEMTVKWEDGTTTTHCTPNDEKDREIPSVTKE